MIRHFKSENKRADENIVGQIASEKRCNDYYHAKKRMLERVRVSRKVKLEDFIFYKLIG